MSSNTTYLITGANRGIGKGLVSTYLARPNSTVIACVRDPTASLKSLNALPKCQDSSLIIVQIDSSSETDAGAAVDLLKSHHNITKLDVVIANAGICSTFGPVADLPIKDLQEHLWVNTIGPVVLFQAVHSLLRNAAEPRFVVVSAILGSLSAVDHPMGTAAYGTSKAAVNFVTRKIHFENPWLIAFPIHPGVVDTDMIASYRKSMKELHARTGAPADRVPNGAPSKMSTGVADGGPVRASDGASSGTSDGAPNGAPDRAAPEQAPARAHFTVITTKESVDAMIAVIDGSTREGTSGRFMNYDGTEIAW